MCAVEYTYIISVNSYWKHNQSPGLNLFLAPNADSFKKIASFYNTVNLDISVARRAVAVEMDESVCMSTTLTRSSAFHKDTAAPASSSHRFRSTPIHGVNFTCSPDAELLSATWNAFSQSSRAKAPRTLPQRYFWASTPLFRPARWYLVPHRRHTRTWVFILVSSFTNANYKSTPTVRWTRPKCKKCVSFAVLCSYDHRVLGLPLTTDMMAMPESHLYRLAQPTKQYGMMNSTLHNYYCKTSKSAVTFLLHDQIWSDWADFKQEQSSIWRLQKLSRLPKEVIRLV